MRRESLVEGGLDTRDSPTAPARLIYLSMIICVCTTAKKAPIFEFPESVLLSIACLSPYLMSPVM